MRASLSLENGTYLKFQDGFELNDDCLVSFYNMGFDFSQIHMWHIFIFEEENSGLAIYIFRANSLIATSGARYALEQDWEDYL